MIWNKGEKNISVTMEMENKTAGLLWIYLNQTFNAEKSKSLPYHFTSN